MGAPPPATVTGTVKPLRVGVEEGALPSPRGAGGGTCTGYTTGKHTAGGVTNTTHTTKKKSLSSYSRAARLLLAGPETEVEEEDEVEECVPGTLRGNILEGEEPAEEEADEEEEEYMHTPSGSGRVAERNEREEEEEDGVGVDDDEEDRWDPASVTHTYTSSGLL